MRGPSRGTCERLFHGSRNIEVTLTGGFLIPRLEIVLGPLCEHMLAAVAADVPGATCHHD